MNSEQHASYTGSRHDVLSCVPRSAMTVLDAGCSNGALGAALKQQVTGRQVFGIEYDKSFCEEAARRLDGAINVDLNAFKWRDHYGVDKFDCIIFADVLEHLVDPWQVLNDATAVLRPNGFIIISLPNIRHVSAIYAIAVRGNFPRASRGIFDKTHLRWFTMGDGVSLCRGANLNIEEMVPVPRVWDLPGGKANYLLAKHLGFLLSFRIVREFISYQFIMVARKQ